jgi:cytochrome P450
MIRERIDSVGINTTAWQQPNFAQRAAKLRQHPPMEKLLWWLLDDPRRLMGFLRCCWPIARVGRYAVITRYDDVMEVLGNDRAFPVPFGPKFKELDRKCENFLLGMECDEKYRAIHKSTMEIFRLADLPRIAKLAANEAERLVAAANGEIDCIAGLLTQVPVHIVSKYFGITSGDPDFALQLMAMNFYSIPHLVVNPDVKPAAMEAARNHIGPLVDEAIFRAKSNPDDATILGRFVIAQELERQNNPGRKIVLTDDVLRATLVGCILGFVPTNNRASGQIMEWLLRHRTIREQAEEAARSGDDDLLERILFEALRFYPINPGPFRDCSEDTTIAAGTRRAKTLRRDSKILVSTQSASFDPRRVARPNHFDPFRSSADTMRFGWGQHWCIGYAIARVQMTQTFKPLLRRGGLRRASGNRGKPAYFGGFFEHLFVEYRP